MQRKQFFVILQIIAGGMILGRIFAIDAVDVYQLERKRWEEIPARVEQRKAELVARGIQGERLEAELARIQAALEDEARLRRPFLSANDRSRWCTVRALVEPEMRVPGAPYAIDRVIQERLWDTIDMVKHDGHLYSSKPPLFATLVAAEYWVLYHVFGLSLGENPYPVAWVVLITFNLIPLGIYFGTVARLAERLTDHAWTQFFVVACACFGTFLSTFAVTLNNHLPAAVCVALALELAWQIVGDKRQDIWRFLLLGGLAALGVTFELPSLIFWMCLLALLVLKTPLRGTAVYLAASAVIAAAFFFTNWLAHGTLAPPYAFRSDQPGQNWYDYEYERQGRVIPSYWRNPSSVDRGEPSPLVYAFHVLIGHHGIFSLTPLWCLSAVGVFIGLRHASFRKYWPLWVGIIVISLVCIGFYLDRPQTDRNYSGMACCFRWVLWLTPLWLVGMLPAVQQLSFTRWGRTIALLLAGISAASAAYPTWSPWTHPWLFQWLQASGWIAY